MYLHLIYNCTFHEYDAFYTFPASQLNRTTQRDLAVQSVAQVGLKLHLRSLSAFLFLLYYGSFYLSTIWCSRSADITALHRSGHKYMCSCILRVIFSYCSTTPVAVHHAIIHRNHSSSNVQHCKTLRIFLWQCHGTVLTSLLL